MTLDNAAVYRNLSLCEYAATHALIILGVAWDREDDNALTISFTALDSTDTFTAFCSQHVPDNTNFDESDSESLARFVLGIVEWEYQCQIVRDHDKADVCDASAFAELDGRKVSFADILLALPRTDPSFHQPCSS